MQLISSNGLQPYTDLNTKMATRDTGFSKPYGPMSGSDLKKIQAEVIKASAPKPKGTQAGHVVTNNDNHTRSITPTPKPKPKAPAKPKVVDDRRTPSKDIGALTSMQQKEKARKAALAAEIESQTN